MLDQLESLDARFQEVEAQLQDPAVVSNAKRLRELSGKSGIVSAGTATAVLLRLQMIGYVTRAEASNGHSRPYKPTAAMEAAFRDRMRIEFEARKMSPEMSKYKRRLALFKRPALACGNFQQEGTPTTRRIEHTCT